MQLSWAWCPPVSAPHPHKRLTHIHTLTLVYLMNAKCRILPLCIIKPQVQKIFVFLASNLRSHLVHRVM